MKKLFLCHYHEDAQDILSLAEELRLRGIIPWVAQKGGFALGDSTPEAARRILAEECFGLLFYASPGALGRDFIRRVELDQAVRIKESDPSYLLVAVPKDLTFEQLAQAINQALGIQMTNFHSRRVVTEGASVPPLQSQLIEIARMVLERVLRSAASQVREAGFVQIQFGTRDVAAADNELLLIDSTSVAQAASGAPAHWQRLLDGLMDVRVLVSKEIGRPRVRITGYRHLTAAFALGWAFRSPSGFDLEIQQGREFWSTDCQPADDVPFDVARADGAIESDLLFVEITAGDKPVRDGVRRYVQNTGFQPRVYVRFSPRNGPRTNAVADNQVARTMANQVRSAITDALREFPVLGIHIFSAVPHALATMIGYQLNAMPPVQLYEYDGVNYSPSLVLS